MRVAIIDPSNFTPPYDHCLATALSRQGCQVVLATNRVPPGPWAKDTIYERLECFYRLADRIASPQIRTYLKGCEHPFDMERLLHSLRNWKPDIIHFQWLPLPMIDGFFLKRLRRIAPLVLTVHDTEPFHGAPSSRFQLIGLASAFQCFDSYIVHTNYSKEALLRQSSIPEHRITVVPHGVFTSYHDFVVSQGDHLQKDASIKKKKILFFGVLKPYKGVDVLIEAFARLPKQLIGDTILQIVGYPKMPIEPLESLARRLCIESSIFWDLRFIDEREVANYFADADVVVLPYRRIDQSGVLMAAMAFGKPIIASRVGGFTEIIDDGVHGLLVNPGDVNSLVNALTCVLENQVLSTRMADAVKKKAIGELSWDSIAKQTVYLYQSVLGVGHE